MCDKHCSQKHFFVSLSARLRRGEPGRHYLILCILMLPFIETVRGMDQVTMNLGGVMPPPPIPSAICVPAHMCSIGFRSGDILDLSITFTFSSKAVVTLAVYLGWLCWKTVSEARLQDMVPVIHALGQVVFSKLFAGFLWASFRRVWDDGYANRHVAVCGVWSEHWQADLPLLWPLKQCCQHWCICFTHSAPDAQHKDSTCLIDP